MQGSTAPEHRTSEASPVQVWASGGRPKPTSKGQDPRGGCPLRLRGHAGPHERGPSRNHRANSRQKVRRPRHNTQDPVDATSHRRRKQLEEVAKHTLTILAAHGFIEVPSLLERAEIGTRRFYEIQNVLLSVPDASHSIVKRTGPVQFTEGKPTCLPELTSIRSQILDELGQVRQLLTYLGTVNSVVTQKSDDPSLPPTSREE